MTSVAMPVQIGRKILVANWQQIRISGKLSFVRIQLASIF